MNFNKKIWLLILCSSLLRMLVACSLELGNDEAYYQTYAQFLQWNYFDHPPMVALMIRLSTFNLFFHEEFFIRLSSLICAAAGTWMIFKIGSIIHKPRTGWIAAILYNTSFYTSIIAGTFILPDSPQVICWLLSMYLMIRILENKGGNKNQALLFTLLGISTGFCIMSKVHGIFLWLGFGAYIIFYRREFLRLPMFWIAGLICIMMIYPIYHWNLENHFITYNYHQGRIRFWGKNPDMDHLLQQLLGSVFYSNPVNFIIYLLTLSAIAKHKIKNLPIVYPLFLWLSLPLIIVLLWTALYNETLPHWSGPSYLSLMLLAACWMEENIHSRHARAWLKTAVWIYGLVVITGTFGIHFLPFRIGRYEEKNMGKGDITLDMIGWKDFAIQLDSLYIADEKSEKMKEGACLISDYWFPAGHLDHYAGIPYHINLLVFGPINNLHHFAWLNKRRSRLKKGDDAYFIYPSNYYGPPDVLLKNDFASVEDSMLIPQYRLGKQVRNFVIYRMHNFNGDSTNYIVPGIH